MRNASLQQQSFVDMIPLLYSLRGVLVIKITVFSLKPFFIYVIYRNYIEIPV